MATSRAKGKARAETLERTPAKRQSRKLAREPFPEVHSSDHEDEVQREVQEEGVGFVTVWARPFDLGKLPQTIACELIRRAPLLCGSDNAKYPASFFKVTGGLCDKGLPFSKLGDEELLPLADLIGTYPLNSKNNRHPLKYITDSAAAKDALHMYQRVYGGSQPDNCEFGTKFIRGLALFSERKQNVN